MFLTIFTHYAPKLLSNTDPYGEVYLNIGLNIFGNARLILVFRTSLSPGHPALTVAAPARPALGVAVARPPALGVLFATRLPVSRLGQPSLLPNILHMDT